MVSNDVINRRSRLVIVVPLTTNIAHLSPSHVLIPQGEGGLGQDSKVLTEQTCTELVEVFGLWTNSGWSPGSVPCQIGSCG